MNEELLKCIRKYIDNHFILQKRMECAVCYEFSGIEEAIAETEEPFTEMLFRLIKEKGISEVDCYKRAGISRQLFSKIRSNNDYAPSRNTAIALALSLHLSLEETDQLLETAGFALSHSSKADLIIEYFIINENWKLSDINEALYSFGENPINV